MKTAVAAVIAAGVLLAGCSSPASGEVRDARYTAGFTYFTACGNGKICPAYSGPSWRLDLHAPNGEHGWRSVDETSFHRCPVGSSYPECTR